MKAFKIISIVLVLVIILYFIYKYLFKKDTAVKEVAAPALTESQLRDLLSSVHPDIQNVSGDLTTLSNVANDISIKKQMQLIANDGIEIAQLKNKMSEYRTKSEYYRNLYDNANMLVYDDLYNQTEINLGIAENLYKIHKDYLDKLKIN